MRGKRRILFQLMSFVSSVCDARDCLSLHPEHRMPVLTMMVCKVTTCLPWLFAIQGSRNLAFRKFANSSYFQTTVALFESNLSIIVTRV